MLDAKKKSVNSYVNVNFTQEDAENALIKNSYNLDSVEISFQPLKRRDKRNAVNLEANLSNLEKTLL